MIKSIEMLELLLYLKKNQNVISTEIKEALENHNTNTIYSRLDRLAKKGWIDKTNRKEAGDKLKPGEEKVTYSLNKKGETARNETIDWIIDVLTINNEIKKKVLKELLTKDENPIEAIVTEFSEQIKEQYSGKALTKMNSKLRSIMKKNLL